MRLLSILTGLPKYEDIPYERPDDNESDKIKNLKNKIEEKTNGLKDEQKEILKNVGKPVFHILQDAAQLLNNPKNDPYKEKNKALYRYAYWTHKAMQISANTQPDYSKYNANAFQDNTYLEN